MSLPCPTGPPMYPPPRRDRDDVSLVLAEMGNTPDEVAATLRAERITGMRGSKCNCPVAKYLRQQFGEPWEVGLRYTYRGVESAVVPDAVHDFIVAFDEKKAYAEFEAAP